MDMTQNPNGQQRLVYVDVVRGLAILGVVWGHVMQSSWGRYPIQDWVFMHWLYSFHMPLFAIVSGMLFSVRSGVVRSVVHKARQLLLPLGVWCVLQYVVMDGARLPAHAAVGDIHVMGMLHNVWNGFFYWSYWFLPAIFLCHVVALLVVAVALHVALLCGWRGFDDTFYSMNTSALAPYGSAGITGWHVVERTFYRLLIGMAGSMAVIMAARIVVARLGSWSWMAGGMAALGCSSLSIYILHMQMLAHLPALILEGSGGRGLHTTAFSLVMAAGLALTCYVVHRATLRWPRLALVLWGERVSPERSGIPTPK